MSDSKAKSEAQPSSIEQKKQEFMKAREADIKVREQIKKKDAVSIQQVKEDLNKEEKELKQFFEGESKTEEKEDPTMLSKMLFTRLAQIPFKRILFITGKKRYEEKMGAYREAIEGLDVRNMVKNFWSYQPPTPEEIETLEDCRKYTKRNILTYAILGVTFTSFVSLYNRNLLGWGYRIFGFGTGVLGGGIYGIISSTEYTLRRLEALGPDYSLGRMAINEIEDFRMDKKKFNRV